MMRTQFLSKWLKQLLFFWLLSVILQSAGRWSLYFLFTAQTVKRQYAADLPALFGKGLLFDIKAASLLTALMLLPALFSLIHYRIASVFDRILAWLMPLLLTITGGLVVANIFYFKTYERQFDVFVFGLLEEDSKAVLKTIWADYPVLWMAFGLIVFFILARQLFKLPDRLGARRAPSAKVMAILTTTFLILLAIGIRGSLGEFPLRQTAMQISAAPQINRLVPNALIALDWARKEHRNSNIFHPVSDAEGLQLIGQLSGNKAASANLNQFYQTTAINPVVEKHAPNVVLAVMESMSGHLMQLNNPQRDLFGRLAPHLQHDWLYQQFVSEGDGTSDTLHRFFVRSPVLNLSQSSAKNKDFPSNMFQPYLDAGYRVIYITAGNGGWRDFDTFLRHLGVQEFADENTLKARYPEAPSSTWGVPDEYMFRYAAEKLAEAEKNSKPVFIMMMSVTNHPPYQLPAPYKHINFTLSKTEKSRLAKLSSLGDLNEILNTFHYANDQLGGFIDTVQQKAPHTIIAFTGDHNMRAIGYPEPAEAALGHAVPFYLYVPPQYQVGTVYDPNRAGSHKDILPTLYELSLSNKRYYRNGCNLTAPTLDSYWCGYGYNPELLILNDGFYNLGNKTFYRWNNKQLLQAEKSLPNKQSAEQIQRGSAYHDFLDWQLNRMVSGTRP